MEYCFRSNGVLPKKTDVLKVLNKGVLRSKNVTSSKKTDDKGSVARPTNHVDGHC